MLLPLGISSTGLKGLQDKSGKRDCGCSSRPVDRSQLTEPKLLAKFRPDGRPSQRRTEEKEGFNEGTLRRIQTTEATKRTLSQIEVRRKKFATDTDHKLEFTREIMSVSPERDILCDQSHSGEREPGMVLPSDKERPKPIHTKGRKQEALPSAARRPKPGNSPHERTQEGRLP